MNELNPGSGRGSGKRGRPPVGKPEQVRLSEAEKALAIRLGDGVLAKGIRNALQIAEQTEADDGQKALILLLSQILADGQNSPPFTLDAMRARLKHLQAAEQTLRQATPVASTLSTQDMVTALELGEGDPSRGVAIALSAARFLGTETARKLNNHGTGHST